MIDFSWYNYNAPRIVKYFCNYAHSWHYIFSLTIVYLTSKISDTMYKKSNIQYNWVKLNQNIIINIDCKKTIKRVKKILPTMHSLSLLAETEIELAVLGIAWMLGEWEESRPVAAEVWSQWVDRYPLTTALIIPSTYVDFSFWTCKEYSKLIKIKLIETRKAIWLTKI